MDLVCLSLHTGYTNRKSESSPKLQLVATYHACIHLRTCFVYVHIVPLTIFIIAISAEVIVRKSFDQSIQLDCPACDSNECPISINDVSTTPTANARYSIQNSQLIVPPRDWGSYGRICCGPMDRQSCYTVCPYGKTQLTN